MSPDTFPPFFIRVWVNQNGTVHFMNIGRLSNDDWEDNANLPSYQNDCAFFLSSFSRFFNSLKIANISELPYGVLGTAPKFGVREEIEFVPVFTSSKQCRKKKKKNVTSCSYRLKRKTRWTCKICCFSISNWARSVWHYHCFRRSLCRCSQDLSMCVNG